jgi:RNA polymerase sigma-70 factor (ECF subfamily)
MAIQRASPAGAKGGLGVLGGDETQDFERLYDEHSSNVYRTALRVLGNRTQAQDVVQDVFMRLWRQPERFDATRGTIAGYLRLMAHTRAVDLWREAKVARRAGERLELLAAREEPRVDDRPALAAELRRDRLVVLAQLTRLPAPQRQALVMAYWGGLTADEIAERSGVPVGTIKSRLRLGLIKMRQRCEPQLGAEQALAA